MSQKMNVVLPRYLREQVNATSFETSVHPRVFLTKRIGVPLCLNYNPKWKRINFLQERQFSGFVKRLTLSALGDSSANLKTTIS